jgi:hypothetical protein
MQVEESADPGEDAEGDTEDGADQEGASTIQNAAPLNASSGAVRAR